MTHTVDALPTFSQINTKTIEADLKIILRDNRASLAKILEQNKSFSWDNLLAPLDDMQDRLQQFWSPISHCNSVVNTPDLRTAYTACLPILSDYYTELGQNTAFFQALTQIAESKEYATLSVAQKQVIQHSLRDFRLSGVALPEQQKKQFAQLQAELSEICNRFQENVLDATNAWFEHITDQKLLSGLPEHALATAAEAAKIKSLTGWVVTLEQPSYMAVITFADDRKLRERIYTAYVTRASDQGPHAKQWDNSQVMVDILHKRQQKAELLGFKNYAEYSLVAKMVKDPVDVYAFLDELAERSRAKANSDFAEIKAFAAEHYKQTDLQAWDMAYYSEKLQQHKYHFSQEALRPYFPVEQVLSGMFGLVKKIFGITIAEIKNVDTWHKDVRFYEITNEQKQCVGHFYCDLFARPHKRSGAWMDSLRDRRRLASDQLQTPIAFLTCNFSAPTPNLPSLLTHEEVETLFHEFGHSLHHLLTKVDYSGVSGINGVPWDAVELPSQFMEEWCWQREVLNLIAKHYESGETLPDDLFAKMLRAKNYLTGMQMVRQLEFSLFDFRIHCEFTQSDKADRIQTILNEVRKKVAVVPTPSFNRFQHGFSHIFSGGYAAGYYSYKWAEVLSTDAFSLFEEKGIFDVSVGRKFLNTILEQGGSREPEDLFVEFRGRKPKIDALLKKHGIV
jgi:oligopeptidase A